MPAAGPRSGEGAAPRGRPFFRAGHIETAVAATVAWKVPTGFADVIATRFVAALAVGIAAFSLAAIPAAPVRAQQTSATSLIVTGAPGAPRIDLLDCHSGRPVGHTVLDAPLAAAPVLSADGTAVVAATRSAELLRLTVPALAPAARVPLPHRPAALAVGSGPDAIVLVGGRGDDPLSAHDPQTLAELARYRHRDGKTATVSALMDNPGRKALVVGFGDLPETWEIVYDRKAPPVLLGYVHDYRNNEAVPLPGRLTARPFVVASPTRAFAPGPVPWEIARIDERGALGVINLEVRREIERPALAPPGEASRVAPWRARRAGADAGATGQSRSAIARGWVAAAPVTVAPVTGTPATGATPATAPRPEGLIPIRAVGWRPEPPIVLEGEVLAVAAEPWGSRVLVAHRGSDDILVSAVDPSDGSVAQLERLSQAGAEHAQSVKDTAAASPPTPGTRGSHRFVLASDERCMALLDADGRWLGSLRDPIREADAQRPGANVPAPGGARPASPAEGALSR